MLNVEYLFLILPLLAGYVSTLFCKVGKDAGINVKFRPPSWLFSVVWPILYILLGISWVQSSRINKKYSLLYILLNIILISWVISYSCKKNKKLSVYILLLSIIVCLLCFSVGNITSKLCLSPLLGWLIFAMLMNIEEVQK